MKDETERVPTVIDKLKLREGHEIAKVRHQLAAKLVRTQPVRTWAFPLSHPAPQGLSSFLT